MLETTKDDKCGQIMESTSSSEISIDKSSSNNFLNYEDDSKMLIKQDNDLDERIQNNNKMDVILEKIGYTKFHYILMICCGLLFFSEGCQVYSFNLLMPTFKIIFYDASIFWTLSLPSALFFGFMIGTLFSGILTHYIGRKNTIYVAISIFSILSTAICVFENIIWVTISRFFIGICIGTNISQYINNLSEFLPTENKEFIILSMHLFYRTGVLYFILAYLIFSPDVQPHNWRWTTLSCVFPVVTTAIMSFIFYKESPKMLMTKRKFDEAVNTINYIASLNSIKLNSAEINNLKEKYIANYGNIEMRFKLSVVFNDEYRTLIILCSLIYLTSSMTSVCSMYFLPILLLKKEHQGHMNLIFQVFLPQVVTIPAVILTAVSCKFIGRKNTILIGFIFCLISNLIFFIYKDGIIIAITLINFFVIFSCCGIKIYAIEAFPTNIRDHAVAICYFCAKLGDTLTPMLCILFFKIYSNGVMLLMKILCIIGLAATISLPYDTLNTHID